ncbi:hypothetical protein MMC18_002534 [Xylographa bjoerkii]|nr:hypothetical protein [Xylographa bjoerkii]
MTNSPDNEPTSLAENERLLASSSYVMKALKSGIPRYRDGPEDTDIENSSTSFSTDRPWQRTPQAELEENVLAARPSRTCFPDGGFRQSAERVFRALSRWVKGGVAPFAA